MAIAALLIGLLLGAIVTLRYMGTLIRKVEAAYYANQIVEMAATARQIRAGHADRLLARLDAALPVAAMFYNTTYKACPGYVSALSQVRRYYAENPTAAISPDLKAILDSVPLPKCAASVGPATP